MTIDSTLGEGTAVLIRLPVMATGGADAISPTEPAKTPGSVPA